MSGDTVREIANNIPTDWTNEPLRPDKIGNKSDVIYLFDEVNKPSVLRDIGYNPSIETMIYTPGAIITTISRANQSKGSLAKNIGSVFYQKVTVRNITTAKKLAAMV